MSASRPNVSLKGFMIARLGRLYSVLLPALVLSIIVAQILIGYSVYDSNLIQNNSNLILRFLLNISFLAESWFLNATPPLNGPFWSVHYEFMYYLIIASCLLVKGRMKYFFILFFVLIAGIKVLLLFPCWLMGSLIYYIVSKDKLLKTGPSVVIFFVSTLFLILILSGHLILPFYKGPGDHLFHGMALFFSWNFRADIVFSFLVAINIYSFFGFSKAILHWSNGQIFKKTHHLVQALSNCSYTLYLFHTPLLFLFSPLWLYDKTNSYHQVGLIIMVMVTVYFIATQTEWKVDFWRKRVAVVISGIEGIYNLVFYKKQFKKS